jgi:hypothetical protein
MYFFVFSLIAIVAITDAYSIKKAYQNLCFFFLILILVIFAATREKVGIDWNAYEFMFYNQSELVTQNIEAGFSLVYAVFSGLDFHWVILFINIINFIFLAFFLEKFVFYKNIALLIFFSDLFFYLNMSGMRQSIALAILLVSVIFIVRRKLLLFIFTVFCACLFHKTAIVFCLAYVINNIKLSYKNIFMALLLAILTALFFLKLTDYISTLGYFRNVELYTDSSYNEALGIGQYIVGSFKRLLPLLMLLTVRPLKTFSNDLFVKLYFVGLLCFLTLYPSFPDIAVRLSLYYLVFDMVIYSYVLMYTQKRSQKLIYLGFILSITAYKIYGYTMLDGYYYNNIF